MKKIAIYAESKNELIEDTTFELISKAKELADFAKKSYNIDIKITTLLISPDVSEESVRNAFRAGSNKFVLIKNDAFFNFNQITYTSAFLSYYNKNPQDFILFPATPTGRMVAPRVTTVLETGLVADCTGLDFVIKDNELKLAATRPTFGAELMATILSRKSPECATIRPKTFKINFSNNNQGEFIEIQYLIKNNSNFRLLDTSIDKTQKVDFSKSKIILSAGFGLYDGGSNEYIHKLQELARIIGADFAISRKLADFKVKDSEYQVGQTGATVTPDLYVAFGISGAMQHIQGMKNSKTIVAINSDPNAEIFKYSDYKIVANAKEVIDQLFLKLGYWF